MTTQAFAPAKINLYLRVIRKRSDGYHELETVMLPLDFGDAMIFESQPAGISLVCDDPRLPVDETNLVVKAAKLLGVTGAKISLQKKIPLAAGLGGGSSNAATTLRVLGQSEPLANLHVLAAKLGSDINFFLTGNTAICRGRGEIVESIPCRLSATVLLVNPGFGISTKWAYERWAAVAAALTSTPPEVSLLARALAEDDLEAVVRSLYNSLEVPSLRKFPVLQLLKEAMVAGGAAGSLMSGSGATVFGLFDDADAAESCAIRIRQQFGLGMWTRTARCRSAVTD